MEDVVISVPRTDALFVAQLMEKMGYLVKSKHLQSPQSRSFSALFGEMNRYAAPDHEWSLNEINAEVAAARQ